MASIWDKLFSDQDYRTAAPAGGYADLYANSLLAGNSDQVPTSVEAMQTGKDFIPVLSDLLAFGEAGHALSEGDRKTAAILAAGGLLGTIPAVGPALARPVMAAGRKAAERLNQTGPVPTMYSNPLMGGGTSDPTQTGWTFKDVDRSLNTSKSENRKIAGDTSRIEEVPINQLYATQPSVNPDFATTSSSAGEAPLVVRKNKKMFIQDGHHRLTKAAEAGSQTAKVRFIDLDNVDNSTPLLDWSKEKTQFVEADQDLLDELFAPSPAEEIAGLLSSGRADDVTDEMLGKLTAQDNSELFDLYQSGATGMDLPMDEASRMARSEGFNPNYFHGSNADITGFDRSSRGTFLSSSPDVADSYVSRDGGQIYPVSVRGGSDFPRVEGGGSNFNRIPESGLPDEFEYMKYDNNGRPFNTDFIAGQSSQEGSPGVMFADIVDRGPNVKTYLGETLDEAKARAARASMPSDVTNVRQPQKIRSRFARFDPRLANLKNLSAGVGAAPIGLLALREEQKRANEEQYKRGLLQ
jgi:hypothetical protein